MLLLLLLRGLCCASVCLLGKTFWCELQLFPSKLPNHDKKNVIGWRKLECHGTVNMPLQQSEPPTVHQKRAKRFGQQTLDRRTNPYSEGMLCQTFCRCILKSFRSDSFYQAILHYGRFLLVLDLVPPVIACMVQTPSLAVNGRVDCQRR